MEGGGVSSGGSTSGSMSTVSKEDNLGMVSSEASSSYPVDESELELALGLSLGCGGASGVKSKPGSWGHGRILTPQDFPSAVVPKAVSSSSSSSSATKANINANASCGTKRSADSFSPPRSGVSQVVGWPPVRTYRMNSLVNQAKSPTSGVCALTNEKMKSQSLARQKIDVVVNGKNKDSKAKEVPKQLPFVKVNMDGIAIGRKVNLNAHSCYETLAKALDDMFCRPSTTVSARTSYVKDQCGMTEVTGLIGLFDGASDFALTYEDNDGDWMLVGDVPWEMFVTSVKRLRIMRTSDANGPASVLQQKERGSTNPIWR